MQIRTLGAFLTASGFSPTLGCGFAWQRTSMVWKNDMEAKTGMPAAGKASTPVRARLARPIPQPAASSVNKRNPLLFLWNLPTSPVVLSVVCHILLLTILALLSMTTDRGRSANRAAVIVDTEVQVRKDIFESVDWDVEPELTVREAGGGPQSLAELEQDTSVTDAEQAVTGLAALASGQAALGSTTGDLSGNSLAQGLGDGGGIGTGSADFFGTSAKGQSILYVIDRSFSMHNNRAMERAIQELLRSLQSLGPLMEFQVIFYNTEPILLELPGKGLVRASPGNIERARQQILQVAPKGGTDHVKALRRALDLRPEIIMYLTDADDMSQADITLLTRQNHNKRRKGNPASINVIQFHHDPDRPPVTTAEKLAQNNTGTYKLIDLSNPSEEN